MEKQSHRFVGKGLVNYITPSVSPIEGLSGIRTQEVATREIPSISSSVITTLPAACLAGD